MRDSAPDITQSNDVVNHQNAVGAINIIMAVGQFDGKPAIVEANVHQYSTTRTTSCPHIHDVQNS
jgi:hypothetical protein